MLEPFASALGKLMYLIVHVDYFTKWIEALENITTANVVRFFKRNMMARFGVPEAVVGDNRTPFIEK